MEPSQKRESMETHLTNLFGFDRRVYIKAGKCVSCPKIGIDEKSFRDELSLKEYTISGLCQECQDKVFGTEDDM